MRTYLATTRLREFWPDGDPLTLLGLWCLDESELWDAGAQRKDRIAPYPWDDRARYLRAAEYVDGFGERLLPQVADALNGAHGVSYPLRSWRIIVGPWLTWYLGALYDRYVCLRELLDRDAAPVTVGLDAASFVVPDDFEHFADAYLGDAYNLQLYTRALDALGVSMPRRPLPANHAAARAPGGAGGPRAWPKRRLRAAMHRLQEAWVRRSEIAIVGVAVPKVDRLRLWAASRFRTACCPQFAARPAGPASPDGPLRERLASSLSGADEFERLAARSVAADMPLAYLEAFRPSADGALQRTIPKVIVSAVGWYGDERFKLFAAAASRRGSRLLGMQHGGYYGMLAGSSPECHEQRVSDEFCSWGWRQELIGRPNVKPMPAIQLARFRPRRGPIRGPRQIVLVTTMHPRYLFRFHGHPVGPQWAQYVSRQHRFVAGLSASVRRDLIVRLYPYEFGWGIERAWRRAFPDIRLERSAPPVSRRLKSATLLVINHPSTTLLEATAADVPYVLCWDASQFSMRPAAMALFEGLRRAGVLYESPEEAAGRVNALAESGGAWWHSGDVPAATGAFRATFASTSRDWRAIWRREFRAQSRRASDV